MIGALLGFVVIALNLRIAVVALAPVLADIERTHHLSDGTAGLLTTLPLVCFGVFAFAAPWLAVRLGLHRLLILAMLVLVVGIALWLVPGVASLFGGDIVAGAGIGIGNIVMPGIIKRDFARQAHLVTGLYTTVVSISGAVAAGLTVPLASATGLGWRGALILWGIPALVAFVVSVLWARQPQPQPAPLVRTGDDRRVHAVSIRALLADPVAWAVTAFMGLQSLGYYATVAWIPTLLQDHHLDAGQAGWMLSFATFPAIISSLTTPSIDRRLGGGPTMVLVATGLCAVAYIGLLADPAPLIYLWMTFLGLGQGASFTLAIHYMVVRSPDHRHTGALSAMAQGFGYLLACVGPAALGAVHSATGGWTVPMAVLTAVLVLQVLVGIQASRNRHVLARHATAS